MSPELQALGLNPKPFIFVRMRTHQAPGTLGFTGFPVTENGQMGAKLLGLATHLPVFGWFYKGSLRGGMYWYGRLVQKTTPLYILYDFRI